jgi:uncharacterized protein YjbI with pentapeptide repeats
MATPAQKKLAQKRLADIREANNARSKWFKWTGFAGKTLWDWLQLLIIPIILAGATIGFGLWQAHLADTQHLNDIQIANDQQQEATLEAYLNDMTTLLLDKKLGSQIVADKAASAEAAVVARAKTLTVLSRLTDPQRKARVVQFLYEAHLIGYFASYPYPTLPHSLIGPIIYLFDADLRGVDLHGTTLNGTDLDDIDLSDANLSSANLSYTQLFASTLNGATLIEANLIGANLRGTDLIRADLSGAALNGADLNGANLSHANLQGANYNSEAIQFVLAQVTVTIKPTRWPKGFDPQAAGAECDDC